jgi:uncharacterized protein (DUF1697 family)
MARLVALLRGINVGSAKQVPMPRLRQVLEALGYSDVETYLRSGNVALSCDLAAAETAVEDIEAAIVAEFGFDSRVVVRTAAQLDAAMAADPLKEAATDGSRHFVAFLSARPEPALAAALEAVDYGPDQLRIVGDHVYLWCPAGLTGGLAGKVNFDRALQVVATVRNWNTVEKLADLAHLRS